MFQAPRPPRAGSESPSSRPPDAGHRLGQLARTEVTRREPVPPVTAGTLVSVTSQVSSGGRSARVYRSERDERSCMHCWQPEVAVVGDQDRSVDLAGMQVDEQTRSDVDIRSLFFLDFDLSDMSCRRVHPSRCLRDEGAEFDVDGAGGLERIEIGLLTMTVTWVALTTHQGGAIHDARDMCSGPHPATISVGQTLDKSSQVEPAPARAVPATEPSAAVVHIEAIDIRPDTHECNIH